MPTSSELIIIDALTDRFRDTWRRGERPRIEQFLDEAVLAHGAAILHDLFCALLEAEISEW